MLPAKSPALSSSFFAAKADGPWRPRVAMSRLRVKVLNATSCRSRWMKSRVLVELPHFARLGHRGPDAPARTAVRRSIGFESGRRVASRSTASRSWQRQQISLPALGARNRATAQSLSATGTAQSLFRRALRLTQRTRARNSHDHCGIAFLIPLPSPDHQHQPRQPPSLSTHLCLRHDPRRYESSCAHAADGSRGHPDHAALCVGHPTRRLP